MSETGINVYIGECGGDGDDLSPFKKKLEVEYSQSFYGVSIGRGAAAAAWVTEIVSFVETHGGAIFGALIALFFSGEKIVNNLDAWASLYTRLQRTLHHEPLFDREGASVLVMHEIISQLSEPVEYVHCNGFQIIDRVANNTPIEIPEPMTLRRIGSRQEDRVSGRDVYYFDIEANSRRFLGYVDGSRVVVIER